MRETIWPSIALLLASLVVNGAAGAADYGAPGTFDKAWFEQLNEAAGSPADKLVKAYMAMKGPGGAKVVEEDGCGCAVDASGRIVDPISCAPVFRSGREELARAVAVEIVPPASWASGLACYAAGAPSCRGVKGALVVGESCCEMADRSYAKIRNDANLYLLIAAPLAEKLGGYSFGVTRSGEKLSASCRIEIDRERRVWSLGSRSEGFGARAWLYAVRHYGARSPEPIGALLRMSADQPPGPGELARARAIGVVQNGRGQDLTIEAAEGRK